MDTGHLGDLPGHLLLLLLFGGGGLGFHALVLQDGGPVFRFQLDFGRRGFVGRGDADGHSPTAVRTWLSPAMTLNYWNRRIDFDTPDGLLRGYYERAPDAIRGHAIWFLGTSVPGWTDAPPDVYAHLQELFNRRLAAARAAPTPDAFQKELGNFGHWFTSEKFDERWSVDMLVAALEISKKAEPDMSVVKRLADLCPRYPVECVAALRLMIEGDREGWLLLRVEDDARRVLKGAIDSNNENGLRAARRLIEDLIAKGQFGFRLLLP
jgi:hypothetical protein